MDENSTMDRAGEDGAERDDCQFVTFMVEKEIFAAPMAPVREIIRLPELARVPLSPASLLGLANLRGRVLPIVDLRQVFGLSSACHTDATRALVINIGTPLGFVVDRVASVVAVDPHQIEPVSTIRSAIREDLLTGVIRGQDGALIMVINFERIIASEFSEILEHADRKGAMDIPHDAESVEEDGEADELQLVSFSVHGQEYAADIAAVQEIVQMPARITALPKGAYHVLGLMTLRERLLPLVSMRAILNLPVVSDGGQQRVVVLRLQGGHAVGVVTDTVDEVLRVPRQLVEPMPALLAKTNGVEEISSVCRLDAGRRLVSVIDANKMLSQDALLYAADQAAIAETNMQDLNHEGEEELPEDEEQVVVFRLGGEEFGVPITAVQEIVRVPEQLTFVPKAPSFVEGVINLRGSVLPVMDQRRRLGLADLDRNDRQRIMVYLLDGRRIGFIVDAVSEVLKISRSAIEDAPHLSGEQRKMLGRVANLERQRRMILLIEPSALLSGTEMAEVAKVA